MCVHVVVTDDVSLFVSLSPGCSGRFCSSDPNPHLDGATTPTGSHVFRHAATSFISRTRNESALTTKHEHVPDFSFFSLNHSHPEIGALPVRSRQATATMVTGSGTQELHTGRAAMAVACVSAVRLGTPRYSAVFLGIPLPWRVSRGHEGADSLFRLHLQRL